MAEEKHDTPKKLSKMQHSMDGVRNLSPEEIEIGKSLNGITNLAPNNLQPSAPNSSQNSGKGTGERENSTDADKK
jgi:hypothetical protein